MFGILLSALRTMAAWTWRPLVVKFATLFGLYYIVTAMVDYLLSSCGFSTTTGVCGINIGVISSAMDFFRGLSTQFPDVKGIRWMLNLVAFPVGFKLMVCAYATRFFVRRLPVIG